MLKKTALVLLCLNLLTPKPVTAEPITLAIVAYVGGGALTGGFCTWWYCSSDQVTVEAAKAKTDAEIKQHKAELAERKRNAHAALLDCMVSEKRKSILNSLGIFKDCEDYRKTWELCKECNQ
jgi:hypothetical protein